MNLAPSSVRLTRRRLLAAAAVTSAALAARQSGLAATQLETRGLQTGDFSGPVDIGGRSLWLERRGDGSPTVILEAGFGNNGQIWDTVALAPDSEETAVLPAVAAFTQVCAYDRPGTMTDFEYFSRSDPVPMPRTAADVVADLHALLDAADVPGPYVLVGHSFGGLVVRLYAATYPDEIAGMVLVDAADEELHNRLRAAMTPEEWEVYVEISSTPPPELLAYTEREIVDLDTSFDQMREAAAAHPLPSIPLVVLTHGLTHLDAEALASLPPGFPGDVIEPAWQAGQTALAELTPDLRHVIATESGHYIQTDQPYLVIEAIEQVVEAVRDPSTWTV